VRRKFTEEILERLVGPFVSGIFAGDPERLSLRAAFPMIHEMESHYHSVIRGAMKSRPSSAGERPTLSSFKTGNATLIHSLADALGPALRCGARVSAVLHERANGRAGFGVRIETRGQVETLRCHALVMATESLAAGRLLEKLSPDFGRLLGEIEYAPVAVVALGYSQRQIRRALDGFGFLVPRREGLRVLGTVWNSSLFPGRAPEGSALMTSFVGGVTDPASASLDPAALVDTVHAGIAPLLGIIAHPQFHLVKQYPRALPQYNLGHTARVGALENLCATLPGLWLAGNYLEGPAIGACVRRARRVAQDAQDFLASAEAARPS
jgi:oxygen-dependent protoporphyrinogen oxidase